MTIDKKTVKNIAWLSRVNIDDKEVDGLANELNSILSWVEQLSEVNTDNVEPMYNALDMEQRMRRDDITSPNLQKEVTQNAPDSSYGFFVVPKVVE